MAGLTVLLGLLFCSNHLFAAGDYPPPSENGHSYYSRGRSSLTNGAGRSGLSTGYGSVSEWDWSSQTGSAKCIDIPSNLTLCRNMEYSQMRLPNLLDHDTLREAVQQATSWVRLVQVSCHPDTQVFLCSLFAPVCLDRPVWPCRSLCDAVKSGCEDRMLKYGFPWPDMLRCDQFPPDNDICVGLRSAHTPEADTSCPACRPSDTYDQIINKYCSSDYAMRIKVNQTIVSSADLKIVADKKRKVFKTAPPLKAKDMRDIPLFIEHGASCDCSLLEQNRRSAANSNNYLVMGRKLTDRLVVENVLSLDRRSNAVNRAVRALRDRNVCRGSSAASGAPASSSKVANANNRRRMKATTTPTTTTTTTTTTTVAPTTVRQNGGRRKQQQQQQSGGTGRNGNRQRGQMSFE